MVLLLRAVARLATFSLMLALTALGAAVALFSIQGDEQTLSLPALARHLQLPDLRRIVGDYLMSLEADGPTAWISVGAGAAAIVVGLLLLIGALAPRRERLLVLEEDGDGSRLAARRRPLTRIAGALAEQERGITQTKTRLRPSRWRRGGRLRLTAFHSRNREPSDVEARASAAIEPVANAFALAARVRTRPGERGKARVE